MADLHLLCRNRVKDFQRWLETFASHRSAHRDAGLHLQGLWRDREQPDEIYFLFRVESEKRARAFLDAAEADEAARESGVIDGSYHFLESQSGY